MALLYPVDHVAHRALVNTAQVIANREGAHHDVALTALFAVDEVGLVDEYGHAA
ncbi:hypothetical protein ACFFQW_16925 [Umezawaea endophytica]|uniref:Uncharacterized protein n=1 Tax=Umezawaea endophytica TaxID=1654476 RepID=A0A9X3AID7_9PSEU|nr:hypothetical protein [Umezawaea endophytica]MCS7480435.1 hypothetical protein [Umezawaea endophytica]